MYRYVRKLWNRFFILKVLNHGYKMPLLNCTEPVYKCGIVIWTAIDGAFEEPLKKTNFLIIDIMC